MPEDLDDPFNADERAAVSALRFEDLVSIDQVILASCESSWRKAAMVVALSMVTVGDQYGELPDKFFAQRMQALEKEGRLQVEGDLCELRTSEVRRLGA